MVRLRAATLTAAALLLWAPAALAHGDPHGEARRALQDGARALGLEPGSTVPELVAVSTPPDGARPREEVRFEYPDVTKDLESLSRFVNKVVGKGKKRRVIPIRIDTGVTAGDRINQKLITHVVIHASLGLAPTPAELARRDRLNESGAANYDSCQSSIDYLETKGSAAHFIVCRDGRVKQMAEMKDYADHVKDPEFVLKSIGIETDAGYAKPPYFHPGSGDWDPRTRWRMSVSLAKLIRMIHHATEGGVPLDDRHILTHAVVDAAYCARSGCHPHTDPGPYFLAEPLPAFGEPATQTTAQGNLMRLVTDKASPRTSFILNAGGGDGFLVADKVGLSRIVLWKLRYSRAEIASLKQAGSTEPVVDKISEWSAADAPADMPPASRVLDTPSEPGEYEVEAQDLVGNRSYTDFTVAPAAPTAFGSMAAASRVTRGSERLVSFETVAELSLD